MLRKCIIPILPVNRMRKLWKYFPVKTIHGGWVWIKRKEEIEYARENYLGWSPPKKEMFPIKLYSFWYWTTDEFTEPESKG
jgi:hypothetical protein